MTKRIEVFSVIRSKLQNSRKRMIEVTNQFCQNFLKRLSCASKHIKHAVGRHKVILRSQIMTLSFEKMLFLDLEKG